MPNNTFNSIPQEITAKALANNFSEEEKSRREAAVTNKDYYYGLTEDYVDTFNAETAPMTVNYTKPIVSKRSTMLYNRKLVRDITGPSKSISILEKVYEDNMIDELMLKVDLLAELTGSVLILPTPEPTMEGGIRLQLWDGSTISIVPDEEDSNKAAAISLVKIIDRLMEGWDQGNPQNERLIQQQIWTSEAVVMYQGAELAKSETNTLGFLPFVNFMGEEIYGQYVGFAPAAIVRKLNAHINQKMTDLSYTIKLQAATPIVIEGYQSGEDLIVTPGRAMSLPVGATANVLDLDPKIEETLEVIQFLEEKVYDTSSVPKISIVGGEGESGRELLVRWFPLTQVFREKAVRYEKYEFQLANMILKILGEQPIEALKIDYPDQDNLPFSPNDENMERDLRLGLTSPSHELMRINSDLDKKEAIAIIEENLDEGVEPVEEVVADPDSTPEDDPEEELPNPGKKKEKDKEADPDDPKEKKKKKKNQDDSKKKKEDK